MLRRNFLAFGGAGLAFAGDAAKTGARRGVAADCACSFAPQAAVAGGAFDQLQSGLKVTGMKVFGVSLTPTSDRPYVFVKLETDQGLVGWGEGTLEGKAGAAMACIEDFRDFVVGSDPMQVEHTWQSMYVHSFYRAGPVMGSAISAIDQALWDIRGKALGMPVYRLLAGILSRRWGAYAGGAGEAARHRDRAGRVLLQDRIARLLRVDRNAREDRGGGEIDAGAARGRSEERRVGNGGR